MNDAGMPADVNMQEEKKEPMQRPENRGFLDVSHALKKNPVRNKTPPL